MCPNEESVNLVAFINIEKPEWFFKKKKKSQCEKRFKNIVCTKTNTKFSNLCYSNYNATVSAKTGFKVLDTQENFSKLPKMKSYAQCCTTKIENLKLVVSHV